MSGDHALLSASAAHRWLTCTPSARFELQFPDPTSEYAEEGTLAHRLAEVELRRWLAEPKPGRAVTAQYRRDQKSVMASSHYSKDLADHVQHFVDTVIERINVARAKTPDALVLLEQRLDYSNWAPEGFGTGDVLIIADDTLEVIDLKFGRGVPVSAIDNPQLRLYGLGAFASFGMLYDFTSIHTTIVQPRLDSLSTEVLSVTDLLQWAEDVVRPAATAAFAGDGEFVADDHCRFCRARFTCRPRAEANLQLAEYDFQDPHVLSHADIAAILGRAATLHQWVSDVQAYALDQAKNHGVRFEGWKLVEGRSNRKYSDEKAVAATLAVEGYTEDQLFSKDLLSITEMEKVLGKKQFQQLLANLVIKPAGNPALVPASDPRPEISSSTSAQNDFQEG